MSVALVAPRVFVPSALLYTVVARVLSRSLSRADRPPLSVPVTRPNAIGIEALSLALRSTSFVSRTSRVSPLNPKRVGSSKEPTETLARGRSASAKL